MNTEKLTSLALEWIRLDFNPTTKNEIQNYLDQKNFEALDECLSQRINFGTSGLRGPMRAGFFYMNDLIIAQTTQGFCAYLLSQFDDMKERGVAIGYDGRYNSKRFAEIAAATFVSKGVKVYFFDGVVPTPLVVHAVQAKNTRASIVVTASHNPKEDNGYKVYWDNGCGIISPHDKNIYQSIIDNSELWEIDIDGVYTSDLYENIYEEVSTSYMNSIKNLNYFNEENKEESMKVVYTAMHGVGTPFVEKAFEVFSLPAFIKVEEQCFPDPDFSTVTFPNPEEGKGALKLAIETAERNNVKLILANDPDADRLAIAEKRENGEWYVFTGNEIGTLFAWWTVTQYLQLNPEVERSSLAVINTAVSSQMLQLIAKQEGLTYAQTLTGFKWIGNKAYDLIQDGLTLIFAFEESIGYMIHGDTCLDKDGVRAAAVFYEMAAQLNKHNISVFTQLENIYRQYGYYETNNGYYFCYEPSVQKTLFELIRNDGNYHESFGRFKVSDIRDLKTPGFDTQQEDKVPILPVSTSDMITIFFENNASITLRGSGTEPKLKYYTGISGDFEQKEEVIAELQEVLDAVISFLEPEKYGLIKPLEE